MSFLTDDASLKYVENCKLKGTPSTHLRGKFSKSDPQMIDLLMQMLELNPYFRPSAKRLMKHKVFDSVRNELDQKDVYSPYRLKLRLDEKEDKINYKDSDYRADLKNRLLKTLVKECHKISPNLSHLKIVTSVQTEKTSSVANSSS